MEQPCPQWKSSPDIRAETLSKRLPVSTWTTGGPLFRCMRAKRPLMSGIAQSFPRYPTPGTRRLTCWLVTIGSAGHGLDIPLSLRGIPNRLSLANRAAARLGRKRLVRIAFLQAAACRGGEQDCIAWQPAFGRASFRLSLADATDCRNSGVPASPSW
jgi:hypothetical protein